MNLSFKFFLVMIFLNNCLNLDKKKFLDPSGEIGFLINRDLCATINICPQEIYRLRELNSYIIIDPPSIGIFKNDSVNFVCPYRTELKSLKSKFTFKGNLVQVNGKVQESGITENDFSNTLNYSVLSFEKKESIYKIKGNKAPIDAKGIYAYRFLNPAVTGFILGSQISVFVPFGTNLTSIIAEIFTTGDSITVNSILQRSGITQNDFTTPKLYTVFAFDGTTQDYIVTVSQSTTSSNEIKAFRIDSINAIGVISGNDINLTVPIGTNLNNLSASFSHDGNFVKVGAIEQISGNNTQNFSNPVVYSVFAQNGSVRNYTVRVTTASTFSKEITSFLFFTPSSTGVINQTNSIITLNVPSNTNRKNLVAYFTTTGASVNINGTEQVNGVTIVNFQAPVIYSVVASDGTIRNYTVLVNLL